MRALLSFAFSRLSYRAVCDPLVWAIKSLAEHERRKEIESQTRSKSPYRAYLLTCHVLIVQSQSSRWRCDNFSTSKNWEPHRVDDERVHTSHQQCNTPTGMALTFVSRAASFFFLPHHIFHSMVSVQCCILFLDAQYLEKLLTSHSRRLLSNKVEKEEEKRAKQSW